MATPILFGVGAVAAAFAGRHFMRRAGKGVAEEFVKGGFKAKMDRKEAIAILGLKYVGMTFVGLPYTNEDGSQRWSGTENQAQGRAPPDHACQSSRPRRLTISCE